MTRDVDPSGHEADPAHADDHTIVVSGDDTVVVSGDDTVAVPGDDTVAEPQDRTRVAAKGGRRERRLAEGTQQAELAQQAEHASQTERSQQLSRSNPAPPVAPPAPERELRQIVDTGLDPQRPIAPVPGVLPWEPVAERGVSRGLPVSYGARPNAEMPVQTGIDEVSRRIGPPPAQRDVPVAQHREQLPSLQERDRRRKVKTLAVYSAVIAISVLGLYVVAAIAFGW